VVAHHLGARAIRSEVKPWFNHRIQSPQRSAAVPTWREDVQREKIAWVFYWWTVFLTTRSPLPRRAAATICLPSRCGAGSLPGQKSRVPTCGFGVGSLVCCAFYNPYSTEICVQLCGEIENRKNCRVAGELPERARTSQPRASGRSGCISASRSGTWKRGQHRPVLAGTCHSTETVTEMVASTEMCTIPYHCKETVTRRAQSSDARPSLDNA